MNKKKTPLRKCIACGKRKPKSELIRIVKNSEKGVIIEKNKKINGRGAYICLNMECIDNAEKNRKLSRALKVDTPEDIYDKLKEISN